METWTPSQPGGGQQARGWQSRHRQASVALCLAQGWLTRQRAAAGYDYSTLLGDSWLFYEAQRSGKLPRSNRIPWRGDSALGDTAPDGVSSVSGGWYDAGGAHSWTDPHRILGTLRRTASAASAAAGMMRAVRAPCPPQQEGLQGPSTGK